MTLHCSCSHFVRHTGPDVIMGFPSVELVVDSGGGRGLSGGAGGVGMDVWYLRVSADRATCGAFVQGPIGADLAIVFA
jgi:hypothetical protein